MFLLVEEKDVYAVTLKEKEEKYTNSICLSVQKQRQEGKREQEVGYNLSVCMLNLLP